MLTRPLDEFPTTYVKCLLDGADPSHEVAGLLAGEQWELVRMDTGHWPMFSRPDEPARIPLDAVWEPRGSGPSPVTGLPREWEDELFRTDPAAERLTVGAGCRVGIPPTLPRPGPGHVDRTRDFAAAGLGHASPDRPRTVHWGTG